MTKVEETFGRVIEDTRNKENIHRKTKSSTIQSIVEGVSAHGKNMKQIEERN